ncbi:MAG: hypothetical protein M4579_002417 [Chaenotheca gracillima]|nr:MAG: hypothetical protein M4579_002417 [Chaenotheca gracillima]
MSPKRPEGGDAPPEDSGPPQAVLAQAAAVAAGNPEEDTHPSATSAGPEHHASGTSSTATAAPAGAGASSGRSHHVPADDTVDANPPPAYSENYDTLEFSQNGFETQARVASDGRVNININQQTSTLSNLLVPALRDHLRPRDEKEPEAPPSPPPGYIPPSLGGAPGQAPPPPLNIVIQVVGSRGDVQPFISLGQTLKNTYGHRVRLATHPNFQDFVEENGLEFFSISGDPAELMAFMVKNPGLMPGFESISSGDVGKRRKGIYQILKGCWRSCIEAGNGMGAPANDETLEDYASTDSGISIGGDPTQKPFVADAIIANPPSFAHIHVAEKLGIPLHMMFTMPWSPTQAFPHPLANIQSSNADNAMTNFVSYALVEMMTWQGLGDLINKFREKTLGLEPISLMWAPGMATRLRIPFTYCWSPALIPKPKDWGPQISIAGFYFLSLASNYTPDPELAAFLDDGPPPVYIGFGSIVVDDPNALTKLIFEAVKKCGVRALVSKGWGGFGADEFGIPDNVYMLGNVPHDWLFQKVSCVVHHGGAGTTAAGMALGKPTVVVPFFGDQPFWGAMIAKAGAGARPIPYKELTSDKLAEAISEALKPAALERAAELGARIGSEKGAERGAQLFHDKLDVDILRCSLAPSRVAVWRVKRTKVRLSALAATVLGNEGLMEFSDLKLYRPCEYSTEAAPWDPITGGASALLGTMGSMMMGVADFPHEVFRVLSGKSRNSKPKKADGQESHSGSNTPSLKSESLSSLSTRAELPDSSSANDSHDWEPEGSDPSSPTGASFTSKGQAKSPVGAQSPTEPYRRSMTDIFHKSSSRSSSRDRPTTPKGSRKPETLGQSDDRMTLEKALTTGKGVGRIVEAGLKSPMDFSLSIARGFHNAPKLYGDKTVRQEDKVTGLQSGLKAAGKEFGFGIYDGISGVVTQPLQGAKKEGAAGFVKGFARGIGGMILKPGAAFWALPGYTFKGVYKELQKHFGSSVQNYIIAARSAQGYDDWQHSSPEERRDIVIRWKSMEGEIARAKRTFGDNVQGNLNEFHSNVRRGLSTKECRMNSGGKENRRSSSRLNKADNSSAAPTPGIRHAQTMPIQHGRSEQPEGFEEAIRASVASTSTGDPEQDRLIERAIRASVSELMDARTANVDDHEAYERAIRASVMEASREKHGDDSEDHEAALERALQESLALDRSPTYHEREHDSGIDTDDDENVKKVLEESANPEHHGVDHDEEIQRALEASKQAHSEKEQEDAKAKTEEEIILEYIKKQSLVEEEHRKTADAKNAKGKDTETVQDDEEMKKAIAESLKAHGQTGESSGGAA